MLFHSLAAALVLIGAFLASSVPIEAKPLAADEILRRAEEVRNPDLDYVADFEIRVVTANGRLPDRHANYSMVVRGKDRTMIVMRTPKAFAGALVLADRGAYWMLLPKAQKPIQLAEAQIATGDISYGDLARANLLNGYTATLAGEKEIEGEKCFCLELENPGKTLHYPKVVYWIAQKRFLPHLLEYYGRTGELLKIVRYGDYRKGKLGLRPMSLEVTGHDERDNKSTITFSDIRPIKSSALTYMPDQLMAFRDVAVGQLTSLGENVAMESLLALLPRDAP